jgi:hypothetical protein
MIYEGCVKKKDCFVSRNDKKIIVDQIDRLVYDLYGLTEEEIKIVEGTN